MKPKSVEVYESENNEIFDLIRELVNLILKRVEMEATNKGVKNYLNELKRTITLRKE